MTEEEVEEMGWKKAGEKKRKTSPCRKSKLERKAAPKFKHTAFVDFNTFIPAGKPKGKVLPYWDDTAADILGFIHKMDP